MATNDLGLPFPTGSDEFAPHVDIEALADSLEGHVVVPVPNVSARDALASTLAPSVEEPLLVSRADAPATARVEMTTDGTNWYTVPLSEPGSQALTLGATGFTTYSGYASLATIRVGGWIKLNSSALRRTGADLAVARGTAFALAFSGAIPVAHRPTTAVTAGGFIHRGGTDIQAAKVIVNPDGSLQAQATVAETIQATNGFVAVPFMEWPAAGA